jgi:hypothetical protein
MSEHLLWDALSLDTKLNIILSEALRSHGSESGLEFVTVCLCNNQKLIEALEKRGRIWDKNKQETLSSQEMFIETAALDINSNNFWRQKKQDLLTMSGLSLQRPNAH